MKRGKKSKKKIATSKKKVSKTSKIKKVSRNKKISRKKISLNDKKLLAVSISLFLIFTFALAFVNSPQNTSVTGKQVNEGGTTTFIKDMFSKTGDLDMKIAKYLFFFMLLILIFSVLNFAKFPEKGILQFLIALPVAFLASAYLVPAEILTILQSYETLGIVLSFILPFVILIFFSAMLVSNEKVKQMSMPKIMLEVILWFFFMVVLGYKIISGLAKGEIPLGLNLPIIIMGAVFLLSFLIFIFNKPFRNYMWNIDSDIRKAKAKATRIEAIERERTRRSMTDIEPE